MEEKVENNINEKHKLKFNIVIIIAIILAITVGILAYTVYYLNEQNKVMIIPESYYHVNTDGKKDLSSLAKKWVTGYVAQHMQKYVKNDRALENIQIQEVTVLDDKTGTVRVDFTVDKINRKSDYFSKNEWGPEDGNKIICNWVITLATVNTMFDEGEICFILRRIRPAAYDLENYVASGQADIDKQYYETMNEKKYKDKYSQCAYQIEDGVVYVTYDNSNSWVKVDVDFENYIKASDYVLKEGYYQIAPNLTVITASKGQSYIIAYSIDQGKTWTKYKGSPSVLYTCFMNENIGYIVTSDGAAMGHLSTTIMKTTDGGKNFNKIGEGANGDITRNGSFEFLTENIGFIIEPAPSGDSGTLYRTDDGYKTFNKVTLPEGKLSNELPGISFTWFDIYDTPESIVYKDNIISLIVGQGSDGDYNGNTKSLYSSQDMGATWIFVKEFKPSPQPWEG